MTQQLEPCTVLVSLNEKRYGATMIQLVPRLCAELVKVQAERDALAAENAELRRQLEALSKGSAI